MSEPSFRGKGQIQENSSDDSACDEERLQARRANVGNVGDMLTRIHRGQMRVACHFPTNKHGKKHSQPHRGAYEGKRGQRKEFDEVGNGHYETRAGRRTPSESVDWGGERVGGGQQGA